MEQTRESRKSKAIHYFPILAVMIFWLGACVISSLMVDTPHITRLGFVTLPLVVAAIAATLKIRRALRGENS
jgi:hypothetical protein